MLMTHKLENSQVQSMSNLHCQVLEPTGRTDGPDLGFFHEFLSHVNTRLKKNTRFANSPLEERRAAPGSDDEIKHLCKHRNQCNDKRSKNSSNYVSVSQVADSAKSENILTVKSISQEKDHARDCTTTILEKNIMQPREQKAMPSTSEGNSSEPINRANTRDIVELFDLEKDNEQTYYHVKAAHFQGKFGLENGIEIDARSVSSYNRAEEEVIERQDFIDRNIPHEEKHQSLQCAKIVHKVDKDHLSEPRVENTDFYVNNNVISGKSEISHELKRSAKSKLTLAQVVTSFDNTSISSISRKNNPGENDISNSVANQSYLTLPTAPSVVRLVSEHIEENSSSFVDVIIGNPRAKRERPVTEIRTLEVGPLNYYRTHFGSDKTMVESVSLSNDSAELTNFPKHDEIFEPKTPMDRQFQKSPDEREAIYIDSVKNFKGSEQMPSDLTIEDVALSDVTLTKYSKLSDKSDNVFHLDEISNGSFSKNECGLLIQDEPVKLTLKVRESTISSLVTTNAVGIKSDANPSEPLLVEIKEPNEKLDIRFSFEKREVLDSFSRHHSYLADDLRRGGIENFTVSYSDRNSSSKGGFHDPDSGQDIEYEAEISEKLEADPQAASDKSLDWIM